MATKWTEIGTSSANSAKTTTHAATVQKRHYVQGFSVWLKAANAAADITIDLKNGTTALVSTGIGSGESRGARVIMDFAQPIEFSLNTAVNLVVGAGGASTVTVATIRGFTK